MKKQNVKGTKKKEEKKNGEREKKVAAKKKVNKIEKQKKGGGYERKEDVKSKKSSKTSKNKKIHSKGKVVNKEFSYNGGVCKKFLSLFLAAILGVKAFAAIVSSNDGSAFITKSEFDSTKQGITQQIDNYNNRLDSMVDGAIATYLNNINVSTTYDPDNQTIMDNGYGLLQVKPGGLLISHLKADQVVSATDVATSGVQKLVTSAMLYNNLKTVPTATTASNQVWTSGTSGAGAWKH